MQTPISIDGKDVALTGRFLKTARLQDEYYVPLEEAKAFIGKLKSSGLKADLFTFVQDLDDLPPRFDFYQEWDSRAILPLTTYDHWLNKQINFKPRNKIRKAQKSGVVARVIDFNDDLCLAIREIYNETPIRQGKSNWHYGKDLETVRREHSTFLDRSDFIGAFFKGELIGFSKVTQVKNYSVLMNIGARISHRDKAPTNAVLAKTIELCAGKNMTLLNYGVWGTRGLNDLKTANGFERVEVPRYFIPLNPKGQLGLKLKLHRKLKEHFPEKVILRAAELRSKWNEWRHRRAIPKTNDAAPRAHLDAAP